MRPPGFSLSGLLGLIDHVDRDSVLDRVAGIHRLHLDEEPAGAGVEPLQLEHRGVPDHLKDIAEDRGIRSGGGLRHKIAPACQRETPATTVAGQDPVS